MKYEKESEFINLLVRMVLFLQILIHIHQVIRVFNSRV